MIFLKTLWIADLGICKRSLVRRRDRGGLSWNAFLCPSSILFRGIRPIFTMALSVSTNFRCQSIMEPLKDASLTWMLNSIANSRWTWVPDSYSTYQSTHRAYRCVMDMFQKWLSILRGNKRSSRDLKSGPVRQLANEKLSLQRFSFCEERLKSHELSSWCITWCINLGVDLKKDDVIKIFNRQGLCAHPVFRCWRINCLILGSVVKILCILQFTYTWLLFNTIS